MPGLTKEQLQLADKIHRDLFRQFVWTSDEDVHGVPEFWGRMTMKNGKYRDDCDSFAIEMDYRLAAAGIPKAARRLGACSLEHESIDHCVLILEGESGLYVVDCNSPRLMAIGELPYSMWYWCDPSGDLRLDWLKIKD